MLVRVLGPKPGRFKEMQIKITLRAHHTSLKKTTANECEDSGKEEPYLLLGDCNWFRYYGNQWEAFQKLGIVLCLKT